MSKVNEILISQNTQNTQNRRNLRYILLFISVTIIWGCGFLFIKDLVSANIPVLFLVSLRFMLGSVFLLFFRLLSPQKSKFDSYEFVHGFIMGIIIFAAFAFQTYGAIYTTPSKSGMLTGLYVIIVPIILAALRRKIIIKPFIDAFICLIGVGILFNVFGDSVTVNFGDILTILCAAAFSIQFIVLEKYSPQLNSMNYTIIQLFSVSIISLACSIIFEKDVYSDIKVGLPEIFKIAYVGFLATGYAYIIQTLIQSKLPSTTVSLLSCLESVFAVLFSLVFGYEVLSLYLIIGAIIMIVSMVSAVLLQEHRWNIAIRNK